MLQIHDRIRRRQGMAGDGNLTTHAAFRDALVAGLGSGAARLRLACNLRWTGSTGPKIRDEFESVKSLTRASVCDVRNESLEADGDARDASTLREAATWAMAASKLPLSPLVMRTTIQAG